MKLNLRPVLQEPYFRVILQKDAQKKGEDCHSSILILVSIIRSRSLGMSFQGFELKSRLSVGQLFSEYLKQNSSQANTCIHDFSRQSENPPAG